MDKASTILNIAAGKFYPVDMAELEPAFLVNVDTMYYSNTAIDRIERELKAWNDIVTKSFNINADIFQFMERTTIMFDRVCIYRFLEHVSMDKVLYFIYLLSTVTKPGAIIDVIVPNYEILARMILNEIPLDGNFEAHNIQLTTELLNEPSCPHASIWTEARAEHFFGLEGRFEVTECNVNYEFDGRDIYLRFLARRI